MANGILTDRVVLLKANKIFILGFAAFCRSQQARYLVSSFYSLRCDRLWASPAFGFSRRMNQVLGGG